MRMCLVSTTCRIVSLGLLVPFLLTADARVCERGTPTPESYTWDFAAEATSLLREMESHAVAVRDHADTVVSLADHSPFLSWRRHGDELTRVKEHVNRMGEIMCRLEIIRRVVSPWQQEAITRIKPMLETVASNANAAIESLNEHRDRYFLASSYQDRTADMYDEASDVVRFVDIFLDYGLATERLNRLREG